MSLQKIFKSINMLVVFSMTFLIATLNGQMIHASTAINDNFDTLYLKPDPRANWWIINWGANGNSQGRWEGLTGSASFASLMTEDDDSFLRTAVLPESIPGYFNNVDVAELHTGFPQEGIGQWTPSNGHPITLEAKVRWSGNFGADGSGPVGTSGVWLWNSPFDISNYNPTASQNAVGFNWVSKKSLNGLLAGLKANIIINNTPTFVTQPIIPVNIHSWVDLKFVWAEDVLGVQTASFYVNGIYLGTGTLPTRQTNWSVEIWNDNEDPQVSIAHLPGILQINYANPIAEQDFDITSIQVSQQ